ncbi:MAG: alanine--glyoxylate aminotransferase family protein [Candidatus Nealsonbacteria bacterium]|nr:alanine--glyoxylate aminotransferase family protein [Candidatus Nealsonbacteria bacterium]
MPKHRLTTPGPTQVPEQALLAMARQVTHHRTPEFRCLLAEVLADLKHVFVTENDVLLLTCSGTGAMEAAVVNLVPHGGKAIVLSSGKFSERWAEICEKFGIRPVRYEVPWGQPFEPGRVEQLLRQHPDAVAVFSTLMETSTGVGHDIKGIGQVVGRSDALLVVDGISGVGATECRTDAWGIDVLVVGAQKALMTPPGLALLAVSPAAWQQIESIDRPAFYFDLPAYRKALRGPNTPYTPAIPLVAALAESLRSIRSEGIEQVWARASLLSRATRAGIEALGLELFAARPADGMTAVRFPEGIDGKALLGRLQQRFGVKLAGGQGPVAGKIFRIAQMGLCDELDVISTLSAIELVLVEMGQPAKLGAGVTAASRVLAQTGGELCPHPGASDEAAAELRR